MVRPRMRGVLRVLLAAALALTSISYFLAEHRVTFAYDGEERTVSTFAPDVETALERHGIDLGPDDVVLPSPEATLPARIEVRRAKDVVVVLNSARRVETVTGVTVEEILDELSVSPEGAYLHPPLDAEVGDGESIVVAQPVEAVVIADGVEQPVVTNVLTAGALLRQMGISVGPHDRVEPSIVAYPGDGPIRVVRVSTTTEEVKVPIPHGVVTRATEELDEGVRKVAQQGQDGVRLHTYRVTYENGRVTSRTLVSTEVVASPTDEVVLVGTRKPVFSGSGSVQVGQASWYHRSGMTAAHRTLPFGTVVKVTNRANGRSVTVTINDRGPYVAGRIIDLSDDAFARLAPLGAGVIDVRIEW